MTEVALSIVSIHLGGTQTKKTAVVRASVSLSRILSGIPPGAEHKQFATAIHKWFPNIPCEPLNTGTSSKRSAPLLWMAHIRDIGATSRCDSDTNLIHTLSNTTEANIICINAPLSLPPCTTCSEETCSGPEHCTQSNCLLMHKEWLNLRANKEKKIRIPQTYTDRYFDFFCRHHLDHPALMSTNDFEPILGSGRAPLTMRALHIKKRLKAIFPNALFLETNTAIAAMGWALFCGYQPRKMDHFRQDLESPTIRASILRRLENKHLAVRGAGFHQMLYLEFAEHHETFLAAMGALSAWGLLNGEAYVSQEFQSQNPTDPFNGWSIIPKEIADRAWEQ